MSGQELDFDSLDDLMLVHGRYDELNDFQRKIMAQKDRIYMRRRKLPDNPHDPFFYHVYEHTLPLEWYYRIVPAEKDFCTSEIK